MELSVTARVWVQETGMMVLLFAEMGKIAEWVDGRIKGIVFYIKFEILFRQSGGDVSSATVYVSKFRAEIWAGTILESDLSTNHIKSHTRDE